TIYSQSALLTTHYESSSLIPSVLSQDMALLLWAKSSKSPSLETFAGEVCAMANVYILQSFRGDISFKTGRKQ
ncbi:hypothetical protein, partial [Sphingobacterium deserti]|uniref:hypothetical protein n=1 Tax=Sphingobacterium deserti TaxID=1229276 RepID=UPI0019D372C7